MIDEEENHLDIDDRKEERGTVIRPTSAFYTNCILLSEGWPSLYFVLSALGFDVSCYSDGLEETSLHKFACDISKSPKLIKSFQSEILDLKDSNVSIWIQGSQKFVQELLLLIPLRYRNISCVVYGTSRRIAKVEDSRLQNLVISHAGVGGLTLGRWFILCPKHANALNITHNSKVPRQLRHILDHTVRGFPHSASLNACFQKRKLDEQKERLYTGKSKIIPGESQVVIVTHCVKQDADQIKRVLSCRELLDVYDVQTSLQQSILNLKPTRLQNLVVKSITKAVPEKILFRLVSEVRSSCLSVVPSPSSMVKETKTVDWLKYEEEKELNDEKASRDDDALVETKQWDWYLARNYNPDLQLYIMKQYMEIPAHWYLKRNQKPLVCTKEKVITARHDKLFSILRSYSLGRFRRKVTSSYLSYMKNKYGSENFLKAIPLYHSLRGNKRKNSLRKLLKSSSISEDIVKDLDSGIEAITRSTKSSFWDWDGGSSLFYWRWPDAFVLEARDGTKPFITGDLPRYRVSQRWPKDEGIKSKMMNKWSKVIRRQYIKSGPVISLTGSFPVPKGENDIRMVYDATKCGLNSQLWSPNFMLPTIDMTLRHVNHTGWFGDIDLGEQFLNFPLHGDLRPYAGIDATELRQELRSIGHIPKSILDQDGRLFLRWERCLMGLRSSPYNATKAMGWADDCIRGDHLCCINVFRWDRFILNLPGMKSYDPAMPKGYKWNDKTQSIAGNFETYVDDIRSSHSSEEGCVLGSRKIASTCNYLGIQDSSRKRRFPAQRPGVWCGAKTLVDETALYTSTTQEKWDRGKNIILSWLQELRNSNDQTLSREPMMSGRGFLVHLSRTYPGIVPFLKGVHHTLESWRRGRKADGWKFSRDEWRNFLGEVSEVKSEFKQVMKDYLAGGEKEAPTRVRAVNRLERDLVSILKIMKSKQPPLRLIRGLSLAYVLYGFGDASGAGFGSSWTSKGGTNYRFGVWGKDVAGTSSNYKELANLVHTLHTMCNEEDLSGTEVYLFTDNSTAEAAFHKGSSTSEKLHELVTNLREMEMEFGVKFILCHVAGERMIHQGTDGLSRGNLLEGVMKGEEMINFIPLHLAPLERCVGLESWIRSWATDGGDAALEILEPENWFLRGHDLNGGTLKDGRHWPKYKSGTYLWQPPPAVADIACEEIRKARSKRTDSTHIFICPRLLTPYWRKHLHRSADLVLVIPAGSTYWTRDMFEPLILALFLPFLPHRPWQFRRSPAILELEDRLQRMWRLGDYSQGPILRKLRQQARSMVHLPERVVFEMLHSFTRLNVPCEGGAKRGRDSMEEEEGKGKIHDRKKR